ncbi:MAG: hypothetical protein KAX13_12585 [Candidatus Krumholzibacteria bacterium]|nr:hypothetical protein [Candidatus Krumholzibacteria bacterium]
MGFSHVFRRGIWSAVLLLFCAAPLSAQVEDHIAAYTGENATGYLNPLAGAIGTTLNSGLYRSAHIPRFGFTIALELPIMGLYFGDENKVFTATTEAGFTPQQTTEASTVVGPTNVVIVDGDGGTQFAFPGGFDVGSFAITAPQLRIGSVFGTEAMIRFVAFKVGDDDLGDVSLFGLGFRHSLSQYMGPVPPVDLAVSFFWQSFKLGENESGEDLTKTNSYSYGVQMSKHFPPIFTPYTGLYYNSYKMDVTYESEVAGEEDPIDITFDDGYVQWTIGVELNLAVLDIFVEYNVSSYNSLAFGLGLGF